MLQMYIPYLMPETKEKHNSLKTCYKCIFLIWCSIWSAFCLFLTLSIFYSII